MIPMERLASEGVVVNSPMSFVGSARRIWRLRRRAPNPPTLALVTVMALLLVVLAWLFVAAWFLVAVGLLGVVTVPYRLLRRGSRKRRAEALRHREVLAALEQQQR